MCVSPGDPGCGPGLVCVSAGAGVRGRMRVPKCRSVREVRTLSCVQTGGTENTRVHVVCKCVGAGSAAGSRRSSNGTGLYVGPGGGFLRDEYPAPSVPHCPCHFAAESVLRGRCFNFLRPLDELRLSCLPALIHVVSAESLGAQAVSFCHEPGCKDPPLHCMVHSKRWGPPQPYSRPLGHGHLSLTPALDMAHRWLLAVAFSGHSDTCPLV